MSSNNSNSPPPPNPVLNAYEQFVRDTPLVTRYLLTTLAMTWFLSFFVDLSYATATIPYFCIYRIEIYRIILSPLMCQNILSLVFAYISFVDSGRRLEYSMGSTAFGWFLMTIAVFTNVVFVVLLFLLYGLSGDSGFLWYKSLGIWTILFGLVATECSRAPRDSQRRLFFVNVPTIYFPLALWALFGLFGGLDLSDLISIGVGYAYGHGLLDKLKMSPSRFHRWEETILANFTERPGWVVGHAATGDAAWSSDNPSSGFSLFSAQPQQQQSSQPSSSSHLTSAGSTTSPETSSFPRSGGRALGSGPTQRNNAEGRAAMLAAAEQRAAKQPSSNTDSNPV